MTDEYAQEIIAFLQDASENNLCDKTLSGKLREAVSLIKAQQNLIEMLRNQLTVYALDASIHTERLF